MQKLFLIGIRDQEMLKFWKFDIIKQILQLKRTDQ